MDTSCDSPLEDCQSPEELLERVDNLVKPYSTDITAIRFFCHQCDISSILCMIDVAANASEIGAAIGGMVFGFSLVCRNINPIRHDFLCANREGGRFNAPLCSKCNGAHSPWMLREKQKPGLTSGQI